MTREQAIAELTRCADICPTTPLAEACRIGAEALKRVDGDDYLRGKADGIRECHTRLRALMGEFGGDKHDRAD